MKTPKHYIACTTGQCLCWVAGQEKECGFQYWTSGQRRFVGQCQSQFMWKPNPDDSSQDTPFTFTDWSDGSPACQSGDDFCVAYWWDGDQWIDAACDTVGCGLCELPGSY